MRRVPRQVPTGIRLMCRHRLVAVAAIDHKRRVESHRVKGVGWRYWYESGPLDASRSKTPETPAMVSATGRFEGQDTTSGCGRGCVETHFMRTCWELQTSRVSIGR